MTSKYPTNDLKDIEDQNDYNEMFEPHPNLKKSITLWVTEEYKELYDLIQKKSSRRFAKKLRDVVMKEIEKAYSKAS